MKKAKNALLLPPSKLGVDRASLSPSRANLCYDETKFLPMFIKNHKNWKMCDFISRYGLQKFKNFFQFRLACSSLGCRVELEFAQSISNRAKKNVSSEPSWTEQFFSHRIHNISREPKNKAGPKKIVPPKFFKKIFTCYKILVCHEKHIPSWLKPYPDPIKLILFYVMVPIRVYGKKLTVKRVY